MSKLEVNAVEPQCGTNLTLGASGDTIIIPAGATITNNGTQTGFGRTGTVDWDTTAKTTNFTAVSGNGYFVNTTSGAITVTLPAGSAGDIVSLADYAATWQTNNVIVSPNGTDKIGGANSNATLSTKGQSVTFVYADSTQGWLNTMDSTSNVRANPYIVATGGTVTCCGNYKIHTFTSPGTFCVSNAGAPSGSSTVEYLVVAGGGGGGGGHGGGGGAGGYRQNFPSPVCAGLPVSVTAYPITVGGGGTAGATYSHATPSIGGSGSNSIFSSITSAGGGGGGGYNIPAGPPGSGVAGGSGGGSAGQTLGTGGAGNTPPVSPPQGNSGGTNSCSANGGGGGGGGAGAAGSNATGNDGQPGGNGLANSISGSSVTYAGGGGGGAAVSQTSGAGGSGGGGAGSCGPASTPGTPGTVNTGGGGGAGTGDAPTPTTPAGGTGGSGIVIIRYKYQN